MSKKLDLVSEFYFSAEPVAGGAIVGGMPVQMTAGFVGFPMADVAIGEAYAGIYLSDRVRAVKSVPAEVIAIGVPLYWDAVLSGVTAVKGALTCSLGVSVKASTTTETDVLMFFYGIGQTLA